MKGGRRIPTDILFVGGIVGGVALTVAATMSVWFFLGRSGSFFDISGGLEDGGRTDGSIQGAPALQVDPMASAEAGVFDDRVLFGQSAAFSGPAQALGQGMKRGILAAFKEANDAGGVHGRTLELTSLDDAYEPQAAVANTIRLIEEENAFALIGAVGTPTSRSAVPVAEAGGVPYIAPFTGAAFLRDTELGSVVNLRASYNQETEEMVARLTEDLGTQRISIMYQDDSYGRAGYRGVVAALERRDMEPASIGLYARNTLAVKTALLDLNEGAPQAVIMIGAYQPVAELISWARHIGWHPTFMTVSFVGSNALASALGPAGDGVFVTQVVPFPWDVSIPIVDRYSRALAAYDPEAEPGFVSLEGYLAGRLAVAGLERCGRDLDRGCFLDGLRTTTKMDLEGFEVGYGDGDNQGSDAVFLTAIDADLCDGTSGDDRDNPTGSCYRSMETLLDILR